MDIPAIKEAVRGHRHDELAEKAGRALLMESPSEVRSLFKEEEQGR
jgi:hypothetical protein